MRGRGRAGTPGGGLYRSRPGAPLTSGYAVRLVAFSGCTFQGPLTTAVTVRSCLQGIGNGQAVRACPATTAGRHRRGAGRPSCPRSVRADGYRADVPVGVVRVRAGLHGERLDPVEGVEREDRPDGLGQLVWGAAVQRDGRVAGVIPQDGPVLPMMWVISQRASDSFRRSSETSPAWCIAASSADTCCLLTFLPDRACPAVSIASAIAVILVGVAFIGLPVAALVSVRAAWMRTVAAKIQSR